MIGRTLAHFRITAAIGAGGMGQVFRATDTKLGREAALKILPANSAADPEMLGRFRREARAVAALNHPNIVTIYSVEEAEGLHFLTMELVAGRSLDRLIPEGGLEAPRILEIAKALSGALAEAHDKGIVHRDLKPSNVMVTDDGSVKVLDFGLAKFQGSVLGSGQEDASTAMQTGAGVVMGTRPYMSPEQVQGRAVDHLTDIFSLGVVLYETSTGKRPFQGQTGADLFASILRDPAPPVGGFRPDLPPDLVRVISRCLEKDPRQRMQTARDIGNELRDAFRSSSEITLVESARAKALATPSERSVVVLPFANVSPDTDTEYFSDGLTDELITDLSRVKALRVISRTTAMRYKGSSLSLREIGAEVKVRWALTGTVRRAGSALRISAQLVDLQRDEPTWAEKYQGTLDDVFDVQERVSRAIVQALDVALSPQESAQLAARPLQDVRAFELYLKAREALAGHDVARAAPLIARAVEIAGRVPLLRALEAMRGIMELRTAASRDPALIASIEQEAHALVAEAPDFAQGYALLGYLAYETGDQFTAVRSLRHAFRLDPADADIRFFLGIASQAGGQPDTRADLAWHALDPLSPLANILVAANTWWTGRFAEGITYLEEAVRLAPAAPLFRWGLGNHYALLGRGEEAARQAVWLADYAPQFPYTPTLKGLLLGAGSRRAEALALLNTIDMGPLDGHHVFHLAESYAAAGAHERAVALVDRAVTMGFTGVSDYCERYSPFFVELRGRADFGQVLARARERAAAFTAAVG